MIPLTLTLKGFYSYRKETTIDFSRLYQSGLFGIFGPVGSGKSSILDAIGFALYDKTERLGAREKQHYMHLDSDRLLVDFTFQTGGKRYRFMVQGRRNGKSGRVDSYKRFSYRFEESLQEWIPLSDQGDKRETAAEEILGLSYDNFRRAVVIPQGTFQDFLAMKGKERTGMLQELFGLHRFDLFDKVKRVLEENRRELERATDRMRDLEAGISQSSGAMQERIELLDRELQELEADLSNVSNQLGTLEKLQQLYQQRRETAAALEELGQQEASVRQSETRLALLPFHRTLGELARRKEKLLMEARELQTGLEEKRRGMKSMEGEILRLQEEILSARKQQEEQEELSRLVAFKREGIRHQELEKELVSLRKHQASLAESLTGLKKEERQQAEQMEQIRGKMDRLAPLLEASSWYQVQGRMEHELAELQGREDALRQEEQKLLKEGAALLEAGGIPDAPGTLKPEKPGVPEGQEWQQWQEGQVQGFYLRGGDAVRRFLSGLEENLTSLQPELLELSRSLKPGVPCPLCGSIDHPHPLGEASQSPSDGVLPEGAASRELVQTVREQIDRTRQLQERFLEGASRAGSLQEQLDGTRRSMERVKEEMQLHAKQFCWPELDRQDPAALKLVQQEVGELKSAAERTRETLTRIRPRLEQSVAEEEERLLLLRELEAEELKSRLQEEHLQQQLDHSLEEELYTASREELEKLSGQREGHLEAAGNALQDAEASLAKLRTEIAAGEATLERVKKESDSCQSRIRELEPELQQAAEEAGLMDVSTLEELEHFLGGEIEERKLRQEVEEYRFTLRSLQEKQRDLDRQLGEETFDEEGFAALGRQREAMEEQRKGIWAELAALRSGREQVIAREEELEKLQKRFTRLENRDRGLETLLNMMKGNGFVRFVSLRYLRQLCSMANKRFYPLTSKSLSLAVDSEGEFTVIDYINGGKERSVRTLSGGQTFQASFSLALALSESIRRGGENFFFLDEGFGSLDRDALTLVMETLKRMRKERSIIGLISHVDALQEEIDTALLVSRNRRDGSSITMVGTME